LSSTGWSADDLLEHVPHLRAGALDHPLGALDVLRVVEVDQPLHDERLEQLERHLLGQAALVQLQLRADDDDRTAGVVDALAEQVLAEPALLALEHVRQRLERAVARAGDRTAAAAVVEQRVDGLLQHPLLVVDDDLGRAEVEQPLQAVVAVDDAAVQVVEVGGREAAAVELHHRAQVRRDDRDGVEHHRGRVVAGRAERLDDLQALEGAGAFLRVWPLAGLVGQDLAQVSASASRSKVEQVADRLGAHAAGEVLAEAVAQLAVQHLVALEVLDLEALEAVPDLVEALDLAVGALGDGCLICFSISTRFLRTASALAPSASSSARSASSSVSSWSRSTSSGFSICFFSAAISFSSVGRSACGRPRRPR
jgi:hypothetical protein